MRLVQSLVITSITALLVTTSYAAPAARKPLLMTPAAPASVHEAPKDSLEVRVWTAEDSDLPALEREVVRELQVDPYSAFAHYLLAHTMVRMFSTDPGDLQLLKLASDLAQQALDLDPNADFGYIAMADILDLMGNPDRGLALLTEAEAAGLKPTWRFYFARARMITDEAQADKALGLFESAMAFVDSERKIIAPYVVAVLQADRTGRNLVKSLGEWNDKFPTPLFDLSMAIAEAEQGSHQEANEHYTRLLARDPTNREAQINKAILLYRDLQRPDEAVRLLTAVLSASGFNLPVATKAMVHGHLGAAQLKRKDFVAADAAFTKAVEIDPSNLAMLDFINKNYQSVAAPKQLVELIERLKTVAPGSGVLYALLGETLSMKLNEHEKALNAFSDAIILDPNRSDYYNAMGLTFYRMKRLNEALKLFTTATEVDPSDASAHYNEACALSLLGRNDEALAKLSEALTLDPRLADSARGDNDFASIKSLARFRELVSTDSAIGH